MCRADFGSVGREEGQPGRKMSLVAVKQKLKEVARQGRCKSSATENVPFRQMIYVAKLTETRFSLNRMAKIFSFYSIYKHRKRRLSPLMRNIIDLCMIFVS